MGQTINLVMNGRILDLEHPPRLVREKVSIAVRALAENLGFETVWQEDNKTIFLVRGSDRIQLRIGSGIVIVNGQQRRLDREITIWQDQAFGPVRSLAGVMGANVAWDNTTDTIVIMRPEKALLGRVIAVDPGHGGADAGAVGPNGLREATVTLDIADKLVQLLALTGAKAFSTRSGNESVSPRQRVELAHQRQAVFLQSIHCNSYSSPAMQGTESYFYNDWEGQKAAACVQAQLVSELGTRDRGVHQAAFYALRHAEMPAVLSEVAFISNPEEEKCLGTAFYRLKAALALFRGIRAFLESAPQTTRGKNNHEEDLGKDNLEKDY